ncbi:MAG: ATP-dependent DNA helicase RecG [Candidatus Pelagibacter sp.]|nr:ATP-dependent DNA helicase RecG [Candidatus Pelagibacter sp.]OUW11712.1 MAG: ATP-dependent DNA helicase RecG [Candidatus Pelagibacter sp. TMED166]|tara:strand:+ start:23818 stop:25860 length:2043 start_codon:yes stop_codon:yes gene_type:complete
MNNKLFDSIIKAKGVGQIISKKLNEKNIYTKIDLLLRLPIGTIDRRFCPTLDQLEIGKISTIFVRPIKYNFPRIRNLPFRVTCEDKFGKIDIVFFNVRENYIRQQLPLNTEIIISGKITIYKNKFQMTNPDYIQTIDKEMSIKKIMSKYSNLSGISPKTIQKIYFEESKDIGEIDEWHDKNFINERGWSSWSSSIKKLHNPETNDDINKNSNYYERLAFDEILSNLLLFKKIRKRIIKKTKINKEISKEYLNTIQGKLPFKLTNDQIKVINEISIDLGSSKKMMRLLQGDVGSGKTIVAFITAACVIKNDYQVAIMVPTEILAIQHYKLFKNLFKDENINVELISSSIKKEKQKSILNELLSGKIDLIIGTHSLFQNRIKFKKLGYIIIDEQHKFGVKQRIELASKGDTNTDVLLMTATPIPRTLIITNYGDLDLSTIKEKPFNNNITTFLKPNSKIDDVCNFIEKRINSSDQVYWVCPIIDESEKLNVKAVNERLKFLKNKTSYKMECIHGNLKEQERDKIMINFLEKKLDLIVCTTIVEVGLDNPNVNTIVIENSERFGLSQLHQLRGRVGRSGNEAYCLLVYHKNLSELSKKRLNIIKDNLNGFLIAEEDLKLRGYGDILGFKQSGEKDFLIADPIYHSHLFDLAKKYVDKIDDTKKFEILLKIFNKQKIFNIIDAG